MFTDPAQILKEHETIIHELSLPQSIHISEFVLADYTSQQFKLYLCSCRAATSATLVYNWLITSLLTSTDPAQILKEHETIIITINQLRFLNLCWVCEQASN